MTKNLLIMIGCFTMLFVMACGSDEPLVENTPETENPTTPGGGNNGDGTNGGGTSSDGSAPSGNQPSSNSKTLIVYFSRTGYNYPNQWLDLGHTARVAGYIKDFTKADTFEILPVTPYPDDYQETVTIARDELNSNARPAIKDTIRNIAAYDTILVGNPVWHGQAPMIIRTFYESYNLTGKVIIPFTTHAGSGQGDAERLAKSYYPNNTILAGLAVLGTNSTSARPTVEAWLKRIGVIEQ